MARGKDERLAEEARRHAFELRRGGRRRELRDGQTELQRERGEQIALGEIAHIDEDAAKLFAAPFALQFEGAVEVVGSR